MLNGRDISNNESGVATLTVLNIDRTAPTVVYGTNGALNVTTPSTVVTVSDAGGSAVNTSTLQYVWDTQNTSIPSSGWTTFTNGGTLTKSASSGTYYLWIKGTDNAGNNIVSKTNSFTILIIYVGNFTYTGSYQSCTVPVTGKYKLEVWGAQGCGTSEGKGGYAKGEISLNAGQVLYLYLGGAGKDTSPKAGWNGGGTSIYFEGSGGYGGGGATDIRIINGAWNDLASLNSRIIVAGGGGGAGYSYQGGAGGGLNGLTGVGTYPGTGGTQSSGGIAGIGTYSCTGISGTLGQGGAGHWGGGSGGGGYYGGGGAGYENWSGIGNGGGGGSSYIGGVINGTTIDGNASMPNPLGGTMTGNAGNGYAKISNIP